MAMQEIQTGWAL